MNVLPSSAQEGLRLAELMTLVPLCPASKEQEIAKRSSLPRVLPLHIHASIILKGGISKSIFLLKLMSKCQTKGAIAGYKLHSAELV